MRPYYTLLKDSFREAFATKTLTFTLIFITLFLAALIPVGLTKGVRANISVEEIVDGEQFLRLVYSQSLEDEASPGKYLWEQFSPRFQERAQEALQKQRLNGDEVNGLTRDFRRELNRQLPSSDCYSQEGWGDVDLGSQLRDDIQAASEGSRELRSANRDALEIAFPQMLELSRDGAIYLTYLGFLPFESPLPILPQQLELVVNFALQVMIGLLLGVLGILISILVTASIMPRTFEPGEITLLLSKPLSRAGLFLTRFLGGCTFTLVNTAYLIVGLWLIVGFNFGVWNEKLLWCIPVYLFAFSIYYVVSAIVGALGRNAILAICMTIAFWIGLFLLDQARTLTEQGTVESSRIRELIPAGDSLLAINGDRNTLLWDEESKTWQEIFKYRGGGPPAFVRRQQQSGTRFLPRYDETNDRIIAVQPPVGRSRGNRTVIKGDRAREWKRESAGTAPEQIDNIFIDADGRTLLATHGNIYDFRGQDAKTVKVQSWLNNMGAGFLAGGNKDSFQPLLPRDHRGWERGEPFAVDMLPSMREFVVYSGGNVELLAQNKDGTFDTIQQKKVNDGQPSLIALGQGRILLASESGLDILDAETLDVMDTINAFEAAPRVAMASADGRWFAALSHQNELFVYDTKDDLPVELGNTSFDRASAIAFAPNDQLLIADRISRVRTWTLTEAGATQDEQSVRSPNLTVMQNVYRGIIRPVYSILPKPAQLDSVIAWLTEDESGARVEDLFDRDQSLERDRTPRDIWTPIWTNLGFVVFMLFVGCVLVARRDF